jgi:hypothetical protein
MLTISRQSVKTAVAMSTPPTIGNPSNRRVRLPDGVRLPGRTPQAAQRASEELYKAVQLEARDWIHMGNTKTALVYRMGNVPVKNDE